eukprot:971642-Pelagomonas_calceolata.AAC.2
MTGTCTKKGVSGGSAPIVLVLWVVVQRGGPSLLSFQGPFLKGNVDMGWQGPQKGVFNLFGSMNYADLNETEGPRSQQQNFENFKNYADLRALGAKRHYY